MIVFVYPILYKRYDYIQSNINELDIKEWLSENNISWNEKFGGYEMTDEQYLIFKLKFL